MPRPQNWKTLPGPSRLSGILAHLRQAPRLNLAPNLKSLKIALAMRDDHFGARHFVKEDLPRIRYANPDLSIRVDRKRNRADEPLPSELVLEFDDGRIEKFSTEKLWSSDILIRVLDIAGGSFWPSWKAAREQQGLPPLDRPEPKAPIKVVQTSLFRKRAQKQEKPADDTAYLVELGVNMNKTGAARILP
ncbi:hypothetical protein K488DRAFT_91502 [Vararia minispora EC-137]|uniref:Uncharacterized protein n=1 Tax=Vararia minispora EC-137 TaxID=1314806 RepID=A0ACB8Q5H9_9AGAM|nr:hypothetical protein K488DRAFT_91502 [Vararia minispora EC-137]